MREPRDALSTSVHEHPELLEKLSVETAVKDTAVLKYELPQTARSMLAIGENKVIDEGLNCAECGTWHSMRKITVAQANVKAAVACAWTVIGYSGSYVLWTYIH